MMSTVLGLLLQTPDPPWQWPLRPPQVVRPFDPPAHPWEPGHRGVDLAARPGQPVYAAGSGRVGFARDLAGRGVVTVVHGRLRTTYLPVRPSVRPGRRVAAGARIGVVEDVLGHCGEDTCLHWGLREGATYLDPLLLVGRAPVRLLPWWPASPADDPWSGEGAVTRPWTSPTSDAGRVTVQGPTMTRRDDAPPLPSPWNLAEDVNAPSP